MIPASGRAPTPLSQIRRLREVDERARFARGVGAFRATEMERPIQRLEPVEYRNDGAGRDLAARRLQENEAEPDAMLSWRRFDQLTLTMTGFPNGLPS